MNITTHKFSVWAEDHPLELGLYGGLFILTLVTVAIGLVTLLEYLSHPMPAKQTIGLSLYLGGVAVELLALWIVIPIMLNQALLVLERQGRENVSLLVVLGFVAWPILWAFFASLPLLSMAVVLEVISLTGLITDAITLFITMLWMSEFGVYLYSRTRRRKFSSLWTLFAALVVSIAYPLIILILGIVLVGVFVRIGSISEVSITRVVFQIAQLSPLVALVYNSFASQKGGLLLYEVHLAGYPNTILQPWVIYSVFWSLVTCLFLSLTRLKTIRLSPHI